MSAAQERSASAEKDAPFGVEPASRHAFWGTDPSGYCGCHDCESEAEAHNLAHDVDRVRERLWRLAALAGWRPGNPADNDATAESYVTEALKTCVTASAEDGAS